MGLGMLQGGRACGDLRNSQLVMLQGGSSMWSLVSLFSFVIVTLHLFQVVSVGDGLRKC